MTESDAIAYAASWGSYMHGGDPGACMYGFSPEIGFKVQSEQHRTNCLEHIATCKERVNLDPDDYEEDELEQLAVFEQMVKDAPLIEAA